MNTHDIELPSSDEAAAHMLPSDLKKFESGEHVAEAFSIAVGNPDETSQPLFTLDQVRAAIEADRKRRQLEAEEVCAEAYQVVGSLLSDLGIFETHHAEKILDNLSQATMVHDDVLPWPSFDRKRRGEPVAWLVRDDMRGAWFFRWKKPEQGLWRYVKPLYAAPQPAEPVDKSKNLQGSVVDKAEEMQGQPAEPVNVPVDKAGAVGHIFSLVRRLKNGEPVEDQLRQAIRGLAAEPRLDAPAQVGHTRFGEGVPWSTVIGAAQRYHAIENTPTKEQERMKKAAERLKAIQPAEPSKQSEVREYLQQTLRTAADEACRLIANSDTPTKFEGIFGHRAEPVAEVSQKISGEPGLNGSILYAGVNWIKAPPPFGTKLYTTPVVAQPSAEPPSSD